MTHHASESVSILLNGEERPVPVDCSIAGLLETLELGGRKVAVALNRDVIPRSNYAERIVASGDRVEILEAVGGG